MNPICRPLTQKELAQRREKARQKHSEMLSTRQKDETGTTTTQTESTNHSTAILNEPQPDASQFANPSPQATTTELGKDSPGCNEAQDQFVAFARVYSGVIRKGQKLFVLGPKHEPCSEDGDFDAEEESDEQTFSQ